MRTVSKAGLGSIAVLVLLVAGEAGAQRATGHGPGAGYPMPGATGGVHAAPPPMAHTAPRMMVRPGPMAGRPSVSRWGGATGGRWPGGSSAPGGYGAYRRPYRGWALPTYWIAPRFDVVEWRRYGLTPPPVGYRWTRYYDDAVLIDRRGSVYDSRGGIDWDGRDDGYGDRHDDGYGGDDMIYQDGGMLSSPIGPDHDDGSRWVSADGATTVTTTSGGRGDYYQGGSTVVTVRSAPMVTTTTTTEVVEDRVSYGPRKVYRTYRGKYVRQPVAKYLRR